MVVMPVLEDREDPAPEKPLPPMDVPLVEPDDPPLFDPGQKVQLQ